MSEPSQATPLPSSAFVWHPSSLYRLGRLIRKEVLSILRDRRTIITLVLMPVLLYPLLTIAFNQFLLGSMPLGEQLRYLVGFAAKSERDAAEPFLVLGLESIAANRSPLPVGFLPDQPIPILTSPETENLDLEHALLKGEIHVGLRPSAMRTPVLLLPGEIQPADTSHDAPQLKPGEVKVNTLVFQLRQDRELKTTWELLYRDDQTHSREAAIFLQHVLAASNAEFLSARLRTNGLQQAPAPVFANPTPVKEHKVAQTASLSVLIPLILILMTITGAVYPAIDLTAGERERGTLDTLVAAPFPRFGLLLAKYVAVFIVAVLTAFVNMGSMTITLLVLGLGKILGAQGLTFLTLIQVFGLMLLLAAFFSAFLLVITCFARSFKEAQAYLIPVMLASLLPGMLPLLDPNLTLDGPCAVAPLLNIVLLARDLFAGQASLTSAIVVVISTLLYALAAIAIAARLFGSEAVLYNEQSGWSDLFRRPSEPRSAATLSSALFCLALMFPLSFLLNGLQFFLVNRPLSERLALGGVNTLLVFGIVPWLWVKIGHVRVRSGFQFEVPPILACLGALLLGVSLWPFIHDLIVLTKAIGFSSLRPDIEQAVRTAMREWREVNPVWIVLVLAILPAILEELTFRGFLFSAIKEASGPRTALIVSSVLFGLFHIVLGNSLAIDRLLPSTLLGLVLGLVAWRSGSVIPGILLHAIHNSTLILMGYYQNELEQVSWVPKDNSYLPYQWLLGGAIVAGVGALLVIFGPGKKRPEPGETPPPDSSHP